MKKITTLLTAILVSMFVPFVEEPQHTRVPKPAYVTLGRK